MFACVHTNRDRQNIMVPIAIWLIFVVACRLPTSNMDQVALYKLGALTPQKQQQKQMQGGPEKKQQQIGGPQQQQQQQQMQGGPQQQQQQMQSGPPQHHQQQFHDRPRQQQEQMQSGPPASVASVASIASQSLFGMQVFGDPAEGFSIENGHSPNQYLMTAPAYVASVASQSSFAIPQLLELARPAPIPMPKATLELSDGDMVEFKAALTLYGLEPEATTYIKSPTQACVGRPAIRKHMQDLYNSSQWQQWDLDAVPYNCNHQAALATFALQKIFIRTGFQSDDMMIMLTANLKLITLWMQEVRKVDVQPEFLRHKYPDEVNKEFNHFRDNDDFNRYIRQWKPGALSPFQYGPYGVWQSMYDNKMLITLIVRIPMIKNFRTMKHHEVTELFKHHCQKVHGLYECFIAASDMMVSDWDGNQEDNPLKYKFIYSKYVTTREVAVTQLMERIPQWFSMMDNHGGRGVPLYWSCSMQLGNHVHKPKKHEGQD